MVCLTTGQVVKSMSKTYCYIIQKGYGSIKIGIAADPESRLKQLQTGNHGQLHLVAKFPFECRARAREMERDLHAKFCEDRLCGEWFHKRILRKFDNRAKLFPKIFKASGPGSLNSYHG